MSKEEKIEILNLIIDNIDGSFFEWIVERKYLEAKNIDTGNILNLEEMYDDLCWMFHEIADKSMELYKQFLQLPKRTLETLEEGDWVEVKFLDTFLEEAHEFPDELRGIVINIGHTWLGVGGWEFEYDDIRDITIIPREAIELLKEVIGCE